MTYSNNKIYVIFHWFVHAASAAVLVLIFDFHLVNYFIKFNFFGLPVELNIFDYVIVAVVTNLIDADHLGVYRRFGLDGVFKFAQKRIAYPMHNFFVFSIFSLLSAFFALLAFREVSILFLGVVIHMMWDILEDVFVFRTSFSKWVRVWGIGTKEMEDMWTELERFKLKVPAEKATAALTIKDKILTNLQRKDSTKSDQ